MPIVADAEQLAAVTYNADGLVAAIVQEHATGEVLMMAWMNEETLRETLESGRTVFWSRSRQQRWRKGDSSGERQWVRAAYYDCDGDTLLFVVEQEGAGACHTGEHSCFHRRFGPEPSLVGATAEGTGTGTEGTGTEGTGTEGTGTEGTGTEGTGTE